MMQVLLHCDEMKLKLKLKLCKLETGRALSETFTRRADAADGKQ